MWWIEQGIHYYAICTLPVCYFFLLAVKSWWVTSYPPSYQTMMRKCKLCRDTETGRNIVDIEEKERAKSLLQSVLKQLCGLESSQTIMYLERFVYFLRYDRKPNQCILLDICLSDSGLWVAVYNFDVNLKWLSMIPQSFYKHNSSVPTDRSQVDLIIYLLFC